jgi:glucose-1-phosphate cytidylyltransferase
MKVVILAGGHGTRLTEETTVRPKPMVEVGGKPILWHIMKIYSAHGLNEFVICCGYKASVIKEYFASYFVQACDVTFDLAGNRMEIHHTTAEPWKVTVVDTGENTMTGGRVKRVRKYLQDETFCMTYGDGVGNVDISALIARHRAAGKLATVTAVQPTGRFGILRLGEGHVTSFQEKPSGDGAWVNGGFFVLEPEALDYVASDETVWEDQPMKGLAADDQLAAYVHQGFWQPMDTVRDRMYLETLWKSGAAPWKVW